MSRKVTDLSIVIAEFIESLPPTIRSDILMFVLVYSTGKDPTKHDDFVQTLSVMLRDCGGISRMGITLRVMASLDHVLPRSAEKIRHARSLLEAARKESILPPEKADALLAGHPLRQKHFDKALSDWKKLRSSVITHQTLMDYEDNLLSPRNQIKDTT